MFGLSLSCQLFQGPAVRTWNCVAHLANLLWYKFNHPKYTIMPRSRRRHSRSRSRSRSHSYDRDREPKRRKIESYDSPQHKRSLSPEDAIQETEKCEGVETPKKSEVKKCMTPRQIEKKLLSDKKRVEKEQEREKKKEETLKIKMQILEEKKKIKQDKEEKRLKEKQEKMEQKQKELEEKQKEKELKDEQKKKEREEKEQKRKEKEENEEKKRKEKLEEKQKQEEKKQKASAAFVNFFKKKTDISMEDKKVEGTKTFMPFETKSDMRLAPVTRNSLNSDEKLQLVESLNNRFDKLYLDELKAGKKIGKNGKTWPIDDVNDMDVVIIEDIKPGESIVEQPVANKMRAKFLMFDDNRRPPYFGTWRKRSKIIRPRKPFTLDSQYFDYEIDSDEEWEEEDPGESLHGSDDDDKENDSENEYEVDNEFFVPHGHLSDDEINDDENAVVSPEAHKAKLKLLKKEFEKEMQNKMEKIKPRVIGCIWHNKDQSNIDDAILDFLKPFEIMTKGPVIIKERSDILTQTPVRRGTQRLNDDVIPNFLKFIHGSTKSRKSLADEFFLSLISNNGNTDVSKSNIMRQLKEYAVWTRTPEGGPVLKKHRWVVHKSISDRFNIELPLLN